MKRKHVQEWLEIVQEQVDQIDEDVNTISLLLVKVNQELRQDIAEIRDFIGIDEPEHTHVHVIEDSRITSEDEDDLGGEDGVLVMMPLFLSLEESETIHRAAEMVDRSGSDFVRDAALMEAQGLTSADIHPAGRGLVGQKDWDALEDFLSIKQPSATENTGALATLDQFKTWLERQSSFAWQNRRNEQGNTYDTAVDYLATLMAQNGVEL